jgi:hypothetical protein
MLVRLRTQVQALLCLRAAALAAAALLRIGVLRMVFGRSLGHFAAWTAWALSPVAMLLAVH